MAKKVYRDWQDRPNVRKCSERDYCDCPHCPAGGFHCMHEDGSDDCTEELCPRFVNGRWIKEKT